MKKHLLPIILTLCLIIAMFPLHTEAYWPQAVDVCAGNGMSAVIFSDHSLWMCGEWPGSESYGDTSRFVKIMEDVSAVSLGWKFIAVVKTDNTLWTWGLNLFGALGNGTAESSCTPGKILDDVVAVSAGTSHLAILRTDNTLWMCGENDNGQLGNGTTSHASKPVQVLSQVRSVDAGAYYTVAVKTDNTLWAWGNNAYGQLGGNLPLGVCALGRRLFLPASACFFVSSGRRAHRRLTPLPPLSSARKRGGTTARRFAPTARCGPGAVMNLVSSDRGRQGIQEPRPW